jgi:hypothetical protein
VEGLNIGFALKFSKGQSQEGEVKVAGGKVKIDL